MSETHLSLAKRIQSKMCKIPGRLFHKLTWCHIFYSGIAKRFPITHNMVVVESFFGRNVSDSPWAVMKYMLKQQMKFQYVVVCNDSQKAKALKRHIKNKYGVVIHTVKRPSFHYYTVLGSAAYYITNVGQDSWVEKKKGMTWLQTWHGTPLKRLFFDIESEDKNVLQSQQEMYKISRKWDYLVSDNAYSTSIFQSCFRVPKECVIETGYPRNDMLYSSHRDVIARKMKEKLGIPEGKKVILYAPTYRDDECDAPGQYHCDLPLDFGKMQQMLGDSSVLLLRMHYYVTSQLDLDAYQGFVYDASQMDSITELYLCADLLITDYSSVFFDYANLQRPMVFFAYDIDKYKNELRGFYFDMENELPGPVLYNEDELLEYLLHIDERRTEYLPKEKEFYNKFCNIDDGNAAARVCQWLLK